MGMDGYVLLDQVLSLPELKECCTDTVIRIVTDCPKQRFQLKKEDGAYYIRAVQGHTISTVADNELLQQIYDANEIPYCIHGTTRKCINSILRTGLSRMKRNHIHLATGLPSEGVKSGIRYNCEMIIEINVELAMNAGIKFFRSQNGVILSPGISSTGYIPPEYFCGVTYAKSGEVYTALNAFNSPICTETNVVADSSNTKARCMNTETEASLSSKSATNAPSGTLYYCIVDFEATCMEHKKYKQQEIIEFPAVFVNSVTLDIEFEFHSYVRPICNPILSQFCTNLTGIEQATVANASPFLEVFHNFVLFLRENGFDEECNFDESANEISNQFLQRLTLDEMNGFARKIVDLFDFGNLNQIVNPKNTVVFVSHGAWDFKTMLPNQCKYSRIMVPNAMRSYINIKNMLKAKYPKIKSLGLASVLQYMNLDLVGRHHSGIDDSRNIARILIKLLSS